MQIIQRLRIQIYIYTHIEGWKEVKQREEDKETAANDMLRFKHFVLFWERKNVGWFVELEGQEIYSESWKEKGKGRVGLSRQC